PARWATRRRNQPTDVQAMTQKTLRILSLLALTALIALPPQARAAEATHIPALSRAEVKATSEKGNVEKGSDASKATQGATKDETNTGTPALPESAATAAPEKPLSEAEKKAAIDTADAITTFDASKVVGNAKPWQIYYQEATSPTMKRLKSLHDPVL